MGRSGRKSKTDSIRCTKIGSNFVHCAKLGGLELIDEPPIDIDWVVDLGAIPIRIKRGVENGLLA